MDVEGSAANAAGVTSQGYLTRYRAVCQAGVRGDAQKPTSPCMPSASDSRCGRGRACRRTRADVSSPRPRPQAVVTSRSPSAQRARGRGGRWEKPPTRRTTPSAWGAAKCGRCAPAPPNVPPPWGAGRRDAPHAAEEPRQTRGEAPHRPWATGAGGRVCRAPAPCGRGTATGGARMDRAPCARDHTHKGRAAARRAAYLRCPAAAFGSKGQ